jgi:hypothetical protein
MSKGESRKLSVYLAEAICNASRGRARFFKDKSHFVAVILLQKEADDILRTTRSDALARGETLGCAAIMASP